jgi:hypothetical protein
MGKRAKRKLPRPEMASSDPIIHPDATLGPDASFEATGVLWEDRDSTNAPTVGEEEEKSDYASGYPALIEKLLHDKLPLRVPTVLVALLLVWFVFVSWLFVQDNSSGALAWWDGLKWFAAKVGFYSLFLVAVAILLVVILWLAGKPKAGRLTIG